MKPLIKVLIGYAAIRMEMEGGGVRRDSLCYVFLRNVKALTGMLSLRVIRICHQQTKRLSAMVFGIVYRAYLGLSKVA